MSDRSVHGIAFIVATIVVCGASFVIASKGGQMLDAKPVQNVPAASATSARPPQAPAASVTQSNPPPAHPPPSYADQPGVEPPPRDSGIYRCSENGSVVYSDHPCANGRELTVRHNSGFNPTPVSRALPQQHTATQQVQEVPARIEIMGTATEGKRSKEAFRTARCPAIEAEIAQIDAMARAGGTAAYQDQLRKRRHELVDEKYQLKC